MNSAIGRMKFRDILKHMKALFVHAHFDDFEFFGAGTFELLKRTHGNIFRSKVILCTDGKAGHYELDREETGQVRLREQLASARIGGYEFELLRLPDGSVPRDASLMLSRNLLAALWKSIRDFQPDILICPPIPTDPLAGVHNDHLVVAEAIRRVAFLIHMPHAFTPEYPESANTHCKAPIILTTYDSYTMSEAGFDLAIAVEPVIDMVAEMSWCHQSQIREWLPWVGRHSTKSPQSLEEWHSELRKRYIRANREAGLEVDQPFEFFTLTGWGRVPPLDELLAQLPPVHQEFSNLDRLRQKISKWRREV